ncbi:hypothetical protein CHS0354_037169 [Potamilus streckersoni]|uniref:GPR180-like N-terminal domain-containing protein n=1 Tax=Potamilus streckersoni TaxID=2493646 RepID=A0AAE0W2I6_9BIVA|nr:hypothetical protein CHS0354_037169 [Potamilus streckersoni]
MVSGLGVHRQQFDFLGWIFNLVLWNVLIVYQSSGEEPCIMKGKIYTHLNWYGFLMQKTFHENLAKIQYQISYPVSECCPSLLIYYDGQIDKLKPEMSCEERRAILPANNNQVIPLSPTNGTVGCKVWTESDEPLYVCIGERTFKSSGPRMWYIVASKCNSSTPLSLNYFFNISGYYGECETDPLANAYVPPLTTKSDSSSQHDTMTYAAIALGIIAGVAIIVAIVFGTLYCLSRKRNSKQKPTGSVTSSQATMTQDIFYVNPSLSDREHSDCQYSRSSSENYYEVIPDRRSYESINTQLALAGHAPRGVNISTVPREHRSRFPSYIFEDYPPPPYQPPHQLHGLTAGGGHHLISTSSAHHMAHSVNGGPFQTQSVSSGASQAIQALNSPAGQHHHQVSSSHQMQVLNSGHHQSHGSIGRHQSQGSASHHQSQGSASGHQLQTTNGSTQTGSQTTPMNSRLQAPSSAGSSLHTANQSSPSTGHETAYQTTSLTHLQNGGSPQGPRPQSNQSVLQLQNGGQTHIAGVRYPLHNTNNAKLLHHAYRIQQFETTA